MKNSPFLLLLLALAACSKKKFDILEEKKVTKIIEYQVFAGKDYSPSAYSNTKADLQLQILKINYKTGESELVWDSTITKRSVADFPSYANKIIVQKTFPVL